MVNTSRIIPRLPLEILEHTVNFYAADTIDFQDGRPSASFRALLSASLELRDCALRVLCRNVVIDCGDPRRIHKLRDALIPQTTNHRLGGIAPYIKGIRVMLSESTRSPEVLDEILSMVDVIATESCLRGIILDGVNRRDEMDECNWGTLPLLIVRSVQKLMRMPTVDTLEVHAVRSLNQYLFQEESSSRKPIPPKDLRRTTVTNHRFHSLDFKSAPMPFNIILPNLKSIVADNLNPIELQNVWKVSLQAHEALEELEIDDEFFDSVSFFEGNDNYEDTHTIPPSTQIDMFPKLKSFKYSHVLFDLEATNVITNFPQITFFAIKDPVPELQRLSLAIRWGNIFSAEFAAQSKEEAITRMADPAWGLLDGILTRPGYFPSLRYFYLTLSQDVQLSMGELLLDAQGSPCYRSTAVSLQAQISESLRPSFCRLLKHSSISFKLNVVVTIEAPEEPV